MSEVTKPIALDETLQNVVTALNEAKTVLEKVATDKSLQGVAKDVTLQNVAKSLGDKDAILLRMAEALDAKDTTQQRVSEINAVTEEKKQEIEAVGEQVKATIPDDYSDLSEKANNASNIFANALKGTASGEYVTLQDVSPIEHTINIKARSKNVVTKAVYKDVPYQESTVSYGSAITADFSLKANKTYTISFVTTNSGALMSFVTYNKPYSIINGSQNFVADGSRKTITIQTTNDYSIVGATMIQVRAVSQASTSGLCSDFMIEEGETATEYTDYVDVKNLEVEVHKLVEDEFNTIDHTVYTDENGECSTASIYPYIAFLVMSPRAIIDVEYNRDADKVVSGLEETVENLKNAIISLGGNV